ncbi:MAG TPA: hypothetical protein VKX17_12265 [Planctomycetota bacterium]|nr:hypothetical protein [Planctomycetota bacterium]
MSAEPIILNRRFENVFLAGAAFDDQVRELHRQLRIRMFIDLDIMKFGPIKPVFEFSSANGTLSEILEKYCTSHGLQWHYWKEANAIWIEYKDVTKQRAKKELSKQFNYNSPDAGDPFADKKTITSLQIRSLFDALHGDKELWIQQYFANRTNGPVKIAIADGKWPKDALDFARAYLLEQDGRAVTYGVDNQEYNPEGNRHPHGDLEMIDDYPRPEISLSASAVVNEIARFPELEPTSELGIKSIQFWHESYRRYQYQKKEITDAFASIVNSGNMKAVTGNAFDGWDKRSRNELGLELFRQAGRQTKSKILSCLIVTPCEGGPEFLDFWKELSTSDDKEFRAIAKQELLNYDEELKARGGKWTGEKKTDSNNR